jgi:DNA-binding transcriptional LysR family regulator
LREVWNRALRKSKHREESSGSRLYWDDVRVFASAASAGSINKAATELRITASNVSRHISDLERRLDVRLLERHKTGVTLTEAGKDLLDRARSMQRMADDIERSVRGRDRRDEGVVTIAAPDGVGSLWVAPRVGDFLSRNPRIKISLDCRVGAPRETDVRTDITIAVDAGQAQIGDDTSALATMHYVFLASPKYLETYGMPKSAPSAAGDHRTLKHSGQIFQRDSWGPRASAMEALAQFSFETNSSAALVEALRGGAGVAAAPTYVLQAAPELVIVGSEQSVPIKLWLVVRQEARNTARVTRVAEWLKSIFDSRSNPWFREEYVAPEEFSDTGDEAPAKPANAPKSVAKRRRR